MVRKVLDEHLVISEAKNYHEELEIDRSMAIYVKLQQSKLRLLDTNSTFQMLPLKPGRAISTRILAYHLSLLVSSTAPSTILEIKCRICSKAINRKRNEAACRSTHSKRKSFKCLWLLLRWAGMFNKYYCWIGKRTNSIWSPSVTMPIFREILNQICIKGIKNKYLYK